MDAMTKMTIGVTAVLTAVATATPGLETPLSPLYMVLVAKADYDMSDWDKLTFILRSQGLARITSETITLTEKGRALAARLEAALAAQQKP